MKKSFISLGLIVAATFALTNCAKEFENPSQQPESAGIPFEITASTPDTKTANDVLNTVWVAGDAINLFHAVADDATYVNDGEFTVAKDDVDAGRFTGTLGGDLKAGQSYDWYALYPYSEYIATPGEKDSGFTYIGHSGGLYQTGYNNMASLKGSVCPLYGIAEDVAAGQTPSVTMNHLSSVIAINVTNKNVEPLTVTTASFTATEDIVGSYFIDVTKSPVVYTPKTAQNTATVTVSEGTALAKDESAVLYLAIKPFKAAKDAKLYLSVNGYSKELVLPKDVTFAAGKIKTLTFNYDKPSASAKKWSLVQDIEDIFDGEYVVLATKDKSVYGYLSSATTSSNPKFTAQTALNPSVSVAEVGVENDMVWNVKQNVDGTYTFTNSEEDYFYGTNAAQGLRVGDIEDKFRVSVHPTSSDAFVMQSVAGTRYVGVYNTDWRSYSTPQDANYDVTIDEVLYDGLKSQLYLFYCGEIPVKAKLSSPTNVSASVQNLNEIVVSWNTVANAGSYDVTCGNVTVNTTNSSYTFTGLSYNTDYIVSVRAKTGDRTTYYSSDPVSAAKVTTGTPVDLMTYSWTLAKDDLGTTGAPSASVSKGEPQRTWNMTYSWPESATKAFNWDNNYSRGVQIGTGSAKNKCNSVTFLTADFENVTLITVGANTASSGNATLSVSVGGIVMKCEGNNSVSLNSTTTPTTYTFVSDTPLDGDVVITITNNAEKALYVKSISINK